ncbi:hypothetical protein Tco_0166946, partial [Tanacetum coccineum]
CGCGDVGGGGVIATAVSRGDGGDGGEVRRVEESEVSGWIDRLTRSILGVAGKIPPESFSGGGATAAVVAGRRWWPTGGGV